MRRAIILGGNPYLSETYRKDATTLFDETGGNTGNLAFEHAIASHLQGNATFLHWGASREAVRAAGDVIVLPLANQLGKHTDLGEAADRLANFGLPVLGIGLGAQATSSDVDIDLTPGTSRWLKTISDMKPSGGPNLGVRGPYTETQIKKLGLPDTAVVIGCPSNFINTKDKISQKIRAGFTRQPRVIAATAGIPHIPSLANIERNLADIVTVTEGAYIVQHGLEMLQLARNEFHQMKPETFELCRMFIAPEKSADEFKIWCRRYARAFYDARAWMDYLTGFDFVIGTRLHGAMLALQAGVPAACIAHDSRTEEMCRTMGIPFRNYKEIKDLNFRNILDYFRFDAVQFDDARKTLYDNYIKLYRDADLGINRGLVEMRF